MRLVNSKSRQTLVDFTTTGAVFYSKYLEEEMRRCGIPIPPGLRARFGGKDFIYLGDPDFQKAFREVFYLTAFDPGLFIWE